jgi:hypothetical protein
MTKFPNVADILASVQRCCIILANSKNVANYKQLFTATNNEL